MAKDDLVVGLDLGTTKVCTIISEIGESGQIDIVGVGNSRSQGLRKGVVVNLDETVRAIERSVREAELMAGVEVSRVYTGIAGSHIRGLNSRGVVAVSRTDKEITQADISRVIDAASAVAIPLNQQILHILPQEFTIDDNDGIEDPIGMSGVRLEADVHIITSAATATQNVIKSINRAGLEVDDIVLESLASSYAVLTDDEKELGVVLVDIGGGTTDIAVFVKGSIWHTAVLPVGGNQITNDIAVGLRTPINEAEELKVKFGCALTSMVEADEMVEVQSVGGRKPRSLSRQILCEIIEPRLEEIMTMINREIRKSGYEEWISAGVVLTGGAAAMDGMVEQGENIFKMPVRIATPHKNIGGLTDVVGNPMFSTGVGLVLYGWADHNLGRSRKSYSNNTSKGAFGQIKRWIKDLF